MTEEVGRRTKALPMQLLDVSQATVRVLPLLRPDNIDVPLIQIAELVALEVVVELHIPFHCRSCKSPAIGVRALGRAAGRLKRGILLLPQLLLTSSRRDLTRPLIHS